VKDYKAEITKYIEAEIEVLRALDVNALNDALNLLEKALESENTVYIMGNGGSAATASHFQNDFNKGVSEYTEKKFRFLCLNDNVPTVMAIANDIGYEEIFRFQLRGRLRPGDVVICISGSGNSKNVLNAAEYAKEHGNTVVGITGFTGGKLREIADCSLHVPVNSMQITEDIHMVFDHLMMSIFYRELCGIEHLKK
jgi:D-sedoheptulose 7-phosphate isomerase